MQLKTSLNLRLIVAYLVILGFALYVVMNTAISEFKPGVRKATEDTLVDSANLFAQMVETQLQSNGVERVNLEHIAELNLSHVFTSYLKRELDARIFEVTKRNSELRMYITDQNGQVVFDSHGIAIGQDYSRWNDVYLTLRGRYGVRSTAIDPYDDTTTVMYVAAPIVLQDKIAGVLTLAKQNVSVQPFIDNAQSTFQRQGLVLFVISCGLAITLIYFMTNSIRKLVQYSEDVAAGKPFVLPQVREQELAKLAESMEKMRHKLDGKAYVEQYIHSLTHEIKSPVAGIKGAAELISQAQPVDRFERFRTNIEQDAERIEALVNQLLKLAEIEQLQLMSEQGSYDLSEIVEEVVREKMVSMETKRLSARRENDGSCWIGGERPLLKMAVNNLIQNAIEFANEGSELVMVIKSDNDRIEFSISNTGPVIPDYAINRVFDRFYSLPRPGEVSKSSGLGLCFVKQIAQLHGGGAEVSNLPHGVRATIWFK